MTATTTTDVAQLKAMDEGRAFTELVGHRVIAVTGNDARRWLHDLLTADIEGLARGQARRSLVLTPTGRIRADVHVTSHDGFFLLLQAADQPEAIDAILTRYALTSEVELQDRSARSVSFAVLGGGAAEGDERLVSRPSVLGDGADVVADRQAADGIREELARSGIVEVSAGAVEAWRVRRGRPRMGPDFGPDSLPSEAGLEGAIDFTKGCFLGQESVAKVRNLGHPPRILRHVGSGAPLRPSDPVFAGAERRVGEVTSAVTVDGVTDAIIRVRWEAGEEPLRTAAGALSLR